MRRRLACWLAILTALIGAPAAAISVGQVDDFQAGTLLNWGGNSLPTNVATGGPAGNGDRYLEIKASNGNLGAKNTAQWAGNYASAGVVSLRFTLRNAGPNAVALRISVIGPGGTFTSTNATVLPAASGWVLADFGLSSSALTQTQGVGTLAQTLAGVTKLLIRHDADPITPPGVSDPATATVGIDNVTALPEPNFVLTLAAAVAALAIARPARIARR
jgi:hypothetical protein